MTVRSAGAPQARHDVVRSRGGAEADRAWREGRLLEAKKLSPGGMVRPPTASLGCLSIGVLLR